MAMPGSGAISFLQLQTEFGGANPISISEYYRGALVPATSTTTVAQWVAYYSATAPLYYVNYYTASIANGGPGQNWMFNGVVVASATSNTTTQTVGSTLYGRGTLVSQTYYPEDDTGKVIIPAYTNYIYKINRWENVSTTSNVNTGVPASSTISMSQFYGAQDY